MNVTRRDFLALGAASVAHSAMAAEPSAMAGLENTPLRATRPADDNLTIRGYLCLEASRITASALKDYRSRDVFRRLQPERRQQLHVMMGLADLLDGARPPVPVHVTGVIERPGDRIEKLSYESLPHLHVTANLYVPLDGVAKSSGPGIPGVLYVCGHGQNQKA